MYRSGMDGIVVGYLLLTGAKGLDVVDKVKLKNIHLRDDDGNLILDKNGKKQPVRFDEIYGVMKTLRFMWTYGEERIGKDRLRQSMRLLLTRSEMADLVIADLARWNDWFVIDKIMELYSDKEYDIPSSHQPLHDQSFS